MAIKTNAVGLDLRRGLVEDGTIRPPMGKRTQSVKIVIDNSIPDGVWVMNAQTLQGVEFMAKGLAAAGGMTLKGT